MGPLFDTRPLGDILLSTGRKMGGGGAFPEKDFYEVLRIEWDRRRKEMSPGALPEEFWQEGLRRGGLWREGAEEKQAAAGAGETAERESGGRRNDERQGTPVHTFDLSLRTDAPGTHDRAFFELITFPTIQFFDGRTANRSFLQEMPDPMTMIAWDGRVEINPGTASEMHVQKGDLLIVRQGDREIQAIAFPYVGVPAGVLAMPMGQGHTRSFSRSTESETGNAARLLTGQLDRSGGLVLSASGVTITKTGRSIPVAQADGSGYQHGRRLARSLTFGEYRSTSSQPPDVTMPLASGYDKERDFYLPYDHVGFRWAMAIDLDRCIGCQACVIACYAENNVGIVGKWNCLRGREMSWLHVERYFEQEQPFVRFLPMLCQHCDDAPCESVCPVFAPNHSKEGINNQVYNRCIGTRYCNQNCPYKVRRFNWFTFSHDHPLEWQLNPDVTVREKGVMEKCSFCIQRIVKAKTDAKTEGRKLKDGEFTTACAQTCPTSAITFGNLMDPGSRVSKLVREARAYQVLRQLNTKPGVIYLKKITHGLKG
jgi:molybdopterin-containing oxidoreductase family iron-sulfur binding subunit